MFDEKRTESLLVRLTEKEKKLLHETAKKHKTTMGSILRELLKKFVEGSE